MSADRRPQTSATREDDLREQPTAAGADVTSRMAGTYESDASHPVEMRPTDRRHGVLEPKTSAAAVFSLVFGLASLFCGLTAVLAPFAVLFGLIGIGVAIAGLRMTKRVGVTGRLTAIGGLVTALLGLLLGAAVLAGLNVGVNDAAWLDLLENDLEQLRSEVSAQ